MICTDCDRWYERTAGHRSVRWCPECLLDHVGLCLSCRRLFDRENAAMLTCSSCSPPQPRAQFWSTCCSVAALRALVQIGLGLVIVAAIRGQGRRMGGRP